MKKLILLLLLPALVISAAPMQAQDLEELPLGSRGLGVLCTDHFPARPARPAGTATMARQGKEKADASAYPYPPYPLEDTFLLHSYPSSNQILYIDFDGYKQYTPFDMDGDPETFNEAERIRIQEIWYDVSEDFMPFTIDVTTEEPEDEWLGHRAVVDGSDKYDYSWAYMNVWPNTSSWYYAYIDDYDNSWEWIGSGISHEIGHTLGVKDHGDDTTGYYMGHGEGWTEWGIIMGWNSWSLGVWDDGDYPNPNNPEDSLAIIDAKSGVDFRPDDHGSTTGTATAVDITEDLIAEGVIEQNTDVDYFSFTMASSGDVIIAVNGDIVKCSTNLDILAKIHDSGGAVLYESNPLDRLWAAFNVTLDAGDYYISVDGTGYDDPGGIPSEGYGYSDYGILGYYSIKKYTGDLNPPTPDPMTWATAPYTTGDSSIAMVATTASDPNGVEYYFTCTAGGGHDSGWQTSPSYEDTNLMGGTQYTYTVTARDKTCMANETAASTAESATTDVDATAPTPDPMTWQVRPYGNSATSIAMEATTASDPGGVEYYFTCTAGGGNDSDWQDSPIYEDTGLATSTEYTYTVTARDKSPAQNTTAASESASAVTGEQNVVLPGNGGVLESFTSEYGSGFVATDLTNGVTNEHGWSSATNPTSPQDFVYSFDSGQDATLYRAIMHGGTAEGLYYSKDVEVWTSANGTDFALAGSSMLLDVPLDSTMIDLGGVTAKKVRLRITSGYRTGWWEMAEFQVFGNVGSVGPDPDMYVNDIAMSWRKGGSKYFGQATVWIKDDGGANVEGATVYGNWSDAVNEPDSGVTLAGGTVMIESSGVKGGGTYTFTVTDVVKSGYVYNASLNVETYDSITAP